MDKDINDMKDELKDELQYDILNQSRSASYLQKLA